MKLRLRKCTSYLDNRALLSQFSWSFYISGTGCTLGKSEDDSKVGGGYDASSGVTQTGPQTISAVSFNGIPNGPLPETVDQALIPIR